MANLKYKNSDNQWKSLSAVRGPKGDNADITLNGTSLDNISIYAPISSGLSGQILQSNGANENPTWIEHQMPTVNNAILDIQKNGTSLGTFSANASENKTINIEVPIIENSLTSTDISKALSANQGYMLNQKFNDYTLTSALEDLIKQYILASHPIGSIEINISGANPSTYLGGTWIAWGTGKVPVGINTSDTDFNTVEKIGGIKTHSHSFAHTHGVPGVSHTHPLSDNGYAKISMHGTGKICYHELTVPSFNSNFYIQGSSGGSESETDSWGPGLGGRTEETTPSSTTTNSQSTSTSESSSNLQPYITCYMWKRTA